MILEIVTINAAVMNAVVAAKDLKDPAVILDRLGLAVPRGR